MLSTVARFFVTIPLSKEAVFKQVWLKAVTERLRWLFWVAVMVQLASFATDIARYKSGILFTNPIHYALLVTHVATTLVWLIYAVQTFRPRFLPAIPLSDEQVIWFVYISFLLADLPRAGYAYINRGTLLFYSVYLFVALLFFLVNHRIRLVSALLGLLVMVPVIWLMPGTVAEQRAIILLEVLLLVIGMFTFGTYSYNAFVNDFRQQQIIEAQNDQLQDQAIHLAADKQRTVEAMEQQTQELLSYILQEQQRNAFLTDLRERATQQQPDTLNKIVQLIDSQLDQEQRWGHFTLLFERLHPHFFANMQMAHPSLNTHDLRMMAMLRLNLSTKEIANLLGISPQSANTARYRLRKRLNLDASEALEAFLQQR